MTREQRVGVVGAGVMGAGIAQCLAQAGMPVTVVEIDTVAAERARGALKSALRLSVLLGRGVKAADIADITARIRWTDRLEHLRDATFVIESVTERIDLKRHLFADLDRHCSPSAIFASGTSAIPIAELAAETGRPDQILGLHFMNPAPLTETVEVITTARTSPGTLNRTLGLLDALGKKGIVVGDGPGFVINRVLMLSIAEAATITETGTDAATIDDLFEGCLGHRMGPLRTADLIGLDNVADTLVVLRETTGDGRYRIPEALAQLVAAGHLGRKTGKGFHEYP
ncbi:3-hydroxyacyl-CoA dehydrogenase family protein [Nocardia goodfellowii]|uniref:3-hydroxybutyryl-CoA dehydrogenase n=1 Tax=Nocardia goodfellowii TaxID=882446 RepID=A0ABS4QC99_9NOCA|nr:3-hydroxyacyl-CoA dehydrogenase NAD-binding domain-containing protein [Nocardia goodfellowii]MBP2189331.1 3-hydroxybutyryl-CoA dehydrogenase [Nocardia goodfellowii]